MRWYLDEDVYSRRLLQAARGLGLDITGVGEAGYVGARDEVHFRVASTQGRCIVTRNYHDFVRITLQAQQRGQSHAGILLVPSSLPNGAFGRIARALKAYADAHPDGLPPYMIDYLQPAD